MKRLNLLYLAGVLVIAIGFFASPTPGWATYLDHARYGDITAGGLNQPAKVAVDSANGDVYVTDAGNKMVKKYDKDGNYLSGFSVSGTPVGIAVTTSNIFVGDSTNRCVWIFSKSGVLSDLYYTGTTHKIDGLGTHSVISMPNTVAVAPAGHIFVLDGDNDKGYIYSSGGKYLTSFGIGGTGGATTNIQFYNPSGIAFGTSTPNSPSAGLTTQNFFVGDQGNNRVLKLSYVYNTTQLFISANSITLPASSPTFGTKGDAFAKFLRISDLAWDNNSRILVLDSLQQVAQVFNSSGVTLNMAANYSGSAVLNQLNIPTGAAVDLTAHKLYVANNQAGSLSVYDTTDGTLPTIAVTTPASAVTPCTANYTVNFNGTAATGSSVTVKAYYYNTSTPTVKTLFSTQSVPLSSGSYSGSATFDLVGAFPNFMWAGTYGVYAEVYDASNNCVSATAPGTVGITIVSGKRRYTCSMQARFGTFDLAVDSDNDGINDGDEIDGTFNAAYAYAATDPLNADTDGDGVDDGVEELQRTLANNISMPLTGGLLASATNPNSSDTDGGGVSDGVEIAKGTSPTAGADDLSSTQDLVADYFIDAAKNTADTGTGVNNASTNSTQATWFDITNPTASPMVVDLAFYNLNGTVNSKVPAAYKLAANQTVRFFPKKAYGVNEGSLEIRANTTSVKADMVRYRENAVDVNSQDSGGAINLWRPADKAATLYCGGYLDGAYRYNGWVYIKNWSDTTANVTVKFYDVANPSQHMDTSFALGGHETKIIRPTSVYGDTPDAGGNPSFGSPAHYGQGTMEVSSNNPTVTGNLYVDRMNFGYPSNLTWDFSYCYPLVSNISTTSYAPGMVTEIYRFFAWVQIANPNEATMNATVNWYNSRGNLVLTKSYSLAPHQGMGIRTYDGVSGAGGAYPPVGPYTNPSMLQPGAPSDVNPNYFDLGTIVVTSDIPHIGGVLMERYNPNYATFDYGYYLNNQLSISTTPYISAYLDNTATEMSATSTVDADKRLTNSITLSNFSDLTSTVNVSYYDATGNLTGTAQKVIGPHKLLGFFPTYADGAPVQGSIRLSSDNPVSGFLLGQEWNYSGTSSSNVFFDYGYAKPFWPAP